MWVVKTLYLQEQWKTIDSMNVNYWKQDAYTSNSYFRQSMMHMLTYWLVILFYSFILYFLDQHQRSFSFAFLCFSVSTFVKKWCLWKTLLRYRLISLPIPAIFPWFPQTATRWKISPLIIYRPVVLINAMSQCVNFQEKGNAPSTFVVS